MHTAYLAAEPASIIYIATGAIGLLFAGFRTSQRHDKSSILMLFCKKSSREKMSQINLT